MANEVVKALLIEVDANLEKLRRELKKGEGELGTFAGKAKTTGKDVAAGADAMANKFAGAARAGAGAMETIARTGKASGEAVKQLIAQGSQAALFFGPQGAFLGAIGIGTLAIVGMFSRTREELAALEKQTTETLNRFAELDAKGMASQIRRSQIGDPFKQSLDNIFNQSDENARRSGLRGRGSMTLGEDAAAIRARIAGIDMVQRTTNQGGTFLDSADPALAAQLKDQLKEVLAVREAMRAEEERMIPLAQQAAQQEQALKAATEATRDATKGATDAAKDRAASLKELQSESERLAETSKRMISEALGTAADRVAEQFDAEISRALQLATEGIDTAANLLRVDELEAAKVAAVDTARALEEAARAMFAVELTKAQSGTPAWMDIDRLGDAAKKLRDQLTTLTPESDLYLKVRQELLKVERELRELATSNDPKPTNAPDPKSEARDMADYAREVQQAADGALQLMQNLGGASENTVSMLRAIGQIAGNLPALSKAISAGGAGGIIAAGLPVLGALSSMFGESPAERQRAQELRENTKAIEKWTERVGALGALNVSGSSLTDTVGGLRRYVAGGIANSGFDARSGARRFGLDLDALDAIAEEFGITLNKSVLSFDQLLKAIDSVTGKLGEFGDDLDSQRRQAEAEIALFGITDPAERLRIRQGATAGRSAALDRVTAGLDLSTAEGREQARRNAQALFDVMRAGGGTLGASDLGGLTGDELLQALLDLIEGLRDVEGAVSDASGGSVVGGVSGYAGLTAAAGARIEDYNRALVSAARDAQATRLDMLARLDVLVAHLAGPIPVPPLSGMTGGSAATGLKISIGSIVLHVQAAGETADDVLDAIGSGLERAASDALYRGVLRARQAAGDLRVVRS